MATPMLSNPKDIAEQGEKIYRERYQAQYEREFPGKFVAIDVTTGQAYVADTPESVLDSAHTKSPTGLFHLIQVGFTGAFRVSYARHRVDRIFC